MQKLFYGFVVCAVLALVVFGCESADKPLSITAPDEDAVSSVAKGVKANGGCATIQDGTICASTGEVITLGYDQYGYNYQSHMFNGLYCNYDRVIGGDFCDINLIMKWNDAWLSNKDCDEDNLLDRHYGFDSYIGSGAWLTNHMWGTDDDGKKWNYFVKIVAAPADAEESDGVWYTADGTEIGPVIWGAFVTIQEVSNDKSLDEHGILYKSPAAPGFGVYKP